MPDVDRVDQSEAPSAEAALEGFQTNQGETIADLSRRRPALLVFLRHLGCTFCREALSDLSEQRRSIEQQGVQIVLVHMADDEDAAALFEKYGLGDAPRVGDPDKQLYHALGLGRGSIGQLFGPKVLLRGFSATFSGNIVGRPEGDPWQMPGAFLIRDGQVVEAFRHRTAADRPDYAGMACRTDGACGA